MWLAEVTSLDVVDNHSFPIRIVTKIIAQNMESDSKQGGNS